jgi:hypothetical protein
MRRGGRGKGKEMGNAEASALVCHTLSPSRLLTLKNEQWPSTRLLCDTVQRAMANGVKAAREWREEDKVCLQLSLSTVDKGQKRVP